MAAVASLLCFAGVQMESCLPSSVHVCELGVDKQQRSHARDRHDTAEQRRGWRQQVWRTVEVGVRLGCGGLTVEK